MCVATINSNGRLINFRLKISLLRRCRPNKFRTVYRKLVDTVCVVFATQTTPLHKRQFKNSGLLALIVLSVMTGESHMMVTAVLMTLTGSCI